MSAKLVAALSSMCIASACGPSGATLFVDVKTDLVPEIEFAAVRVELLADDPSGRVRVDTVAMRSDDYVAGVRAAELEGLSDGYLATVRVALLDVGGTVRLERIARVTLSGGANGLTVLLTRDCEGVRCPAAGDTPAAVACLGGACVDPTCSEEHPELCPAPECTADGECATGAACADPRCIAGTCALVGNDGRCAAGEWCQPVDGCQPLPAATDGGVPDGGPSCVDGAMNGGETGVDCGGPCIPCGWWNELFTRRNAIDFTYTSGPDLVDFPLMVRVTADAFDLAAFEPAGEDLRFVDGDGNVLPHEIESWSMTGTSYVWVKAPVVRAIPSGERTDRIYAYYGYDAGGAVPFATPPEDTWSDDHVLVHHSTGGRDSTRNGNDGTATGTGIGAGGPLGFALALPGGASAHVAVPASKSLDAITTAFTVSALVTEVGTNPTTHAFICRQSGASSGNTDDYWLGMQSGLFRGEALLDGSVLQTSLATGFAGLPAYVALTWDGSVLRVFRNGVETVSIVGSDPGAVIAPSGGSVYIGADRDSLPVGGAATGSFFAGLIDEVRIDRIARSFEWISATHATYLGDFVSVSANEVLR